MMVNEIFKHFATSYVSTKQNLDPNKAHGHEEMSIKMLKLYGPEYEKFILLELCLDIFDVYKKSNIVPVHEKEDIKLIKNYLYCLYFQFAKNYWENLCLTQFFDTRNMLSVHQS